MLQVVAIPVMFKLMVQSEMDVLSMDRKGYCWLVNPCPCAPEIKFLVVTVLSFSAACVT